MLCERCGKNERIKYIDHTSKWCYSCQLKNLVEFLSLPDEPPPNTGLQADGATPWLCWNCMNINVLDVDECVFCSRPAAKA